MRWGIQQFLLSSCVPPCPWKLLCAAIMLSTSSQVVSKLCTSIAWQPNKTQMVGHSPELLVQWVCSALFPQSSLLTGSMHCWCSDPSWRTSWQGEGQSKLSPRMLGMLVDGSLITTHCSFFPCFRFFYLQFLCLELRELRRTWRGHTSLLLSLLHIPQYLAEDNVCTKTMKGLQTRVAAEPRLSHLCQSSQVPRL